MNEHRIASRRRVLKAGTIEFGGGGIDCTVRNLSETGAALEVVSPLFIPDRFTLFVPSDQFKRPCHIVWRREKRIGVAFDLGRHQELTGGRFVRPSLVELAKRTPQ